MSVRILLLGGTGDALKVARALGRGHVYSLAGLGKVPDDLRCDVRVGGFGGAADRQRFAGQRGQIQHQRAVDDPGVGTDPVALGDDQHIAGDQIPGGDL